MKTFLTKCVQLFFVANTTSILLCVTNPSLAQQTIKKLDGSKIPTVDVDLAVKNIMHKTSVQGVNLAIINSNRIAYVQSYGYSNKPENKLLDTATIVYGASLSKAVFAYLVLKLVEKNIIDLDTPLYKYLKKPVPEYSYWSDLKNDERWRQITASMCLSHTTGLPNVRIFDPVTNKMDSLGVIKIYFTPGSKYAYSGEGFKFLQLVIEELAGRNIDQLAQEMIFKPLGMKRTGFVWHENFGDNNVAVGHLNNGLIDKKRKRKEPVAGGSMVTTIADYARFIQHVMLRKGLSRKSYETMLSPHIVIHSITQFPPITTGTSTENDAIGLSYGLGWGLFNCGSLGQAFFKEGNGGSWRNYNVNFPAKGCAIIILSNSENGEYTFQPLIETLMGNTCIPWKWEGYLPYVANEKK